MNIFELPWSFMFVVLLLITLLVVREVLIALQMSRNHPEQKMAVFNGIILVMLLLGGVYGIRYFADHDAAFAEFFPRYPTARYAPDREIFDNQSEWIYVTQDEPSLVIAYYKEKSHIFGYQTVSEDSATSTRLMLVRGQHTVFLTVVRESRNSVLYFSEHGEVREYQRNP